MDEMQELREHAEAQAALFRVGVEDEPGAVEVFIPGIGKLER